MSAGSGVPFEGGAGVPPVRGTGVTVRELGYWAPRRSGRATGS
jgi:hypothetical protein